MAFKKKETVAVEGGIESKSEQKVESKVDVVDPDKEETKSDSGDTDEKSSADPAEKKYEEKIPSPDKVAEKAVSDVEKPKPILTKAKTVTAPIPPKVEEKTVKAPAKAEKKEPEPYEFKIDPSKNYEFKLVDSNSPSTTIPRRLKIWDEEKGKIRVARYSSVEESIFEDEQGENLPPEADIEFVKGSLTVPGVKASLIKFLLAHDWLEGKKLINPEHERARGTFKLIDRNVGVIDSLSTAKKIAKATGIVADAEPEELAAFMLSVFGFDGTSDQGVTVASEAIELEAYMRAKTNPDVFIKGFTDERHKIKAVVIAALQAKIISDEDDGIITRTDTGAVAYKYDEEKYNFSGADALTAWINDTPDGKKFYGTLVSDLEG